MIICLIVEIYRKFTLRSTILSEPSKPVQTEWKIHIISTVPADSCCPISTSVLGFVQILHNAAFTATRIPCATTLSTICGFFVSLVGTEELGHLEMVGTIVHQLTRNLSDEDIRSAGFDTYFVDHTTGVYPTAASGFPWSAGSISVSGDMIADLTENLAAEQKARLTYDNILRLSDDPDVTDAIKFLRAREIVHFQRFGEGLRLAKDRLNEKNVYFMNPSFDK